jgi:hypothetical protein
MSGKSTASETQYEFDSHAVTNNEIINNTMYKTNIQAWDEVMKSFSESKRRTKLCIQMFGQENLIGLTESQRDEFWKAV